MLCAVLKFSSSGFEFFLIYELSVALIWFLAVELIAVFLRFFLIEELDSGLGYKVYYIVEEIEETFILNSL